MADSTVVIALAGKGGVGKTSLSAAIVRILSEKRPDAKILAIDADPAVGLSVALGVEVTETLDRIRKRVAEDITGKLRDTQDILAEAKFRIYEAMEEEKGFAFDTLEAEVDVAREPVCPVAVKGGMRYLTKSFYETVSHGAYPGRSLAHTELGFFKGRCHGHDTRNILSSGTFPPFLRSAVDYVREGDALPDIEEAYTLRPVEFVG